MLLGQSIMWGLFARLEWRREKHRAARNHAKLTGGAAQLDKYTPKTRFAQAGRTQHGSEGDHWGDWVPGWQGHNRQPGPPGTIQERALKR
jgi:hypothetical protein